MTCDNNFLWDSALDKLSLSFSSIPFGLWFNELFKTKTQAPVSQPPASQGKINIGTMDVSDSDSEEEGQVNQIMDYQNSSIDLASKHFVMARPSMLGVPPPLAM